MTRPSCVAVNLFTENRSFMFSKTDCSKDNLAALFFQILRKISASHEEAAVNRSLCLRKKIIEDTKSECHKLMPTATDEQWKDAYAHLASNLHY